MMRNNLKLYLLTWILLMKPVSLHKACPAQPVSTSFAIDGTINVNVEQWHQMTLLIQGITATIPKGSDISLTFVNEERKEMATFVVKKQKLNITDVLDPADWKPTGHSISAAPLAQEASIRFTSCDCKKKAEIFVLLVSDTTILQAFPPALLKKKIFVLVFGSSIPREFKSLPSSDNHIHLIKAADDITKHFDLVSKQLCKDSFFKCDVDKYMEKRSSVCRSCMSVCSNKTVEQTSSCKQQCPYILIPSRHYAIKITDQSVHDDVLTEGKGSTEKTIVIMVLCGFGIAIVCLNIGLMLVCRRKKLLCFAPRGTQRRTELIEICVIQHDTVPVPETVGPGNQALNQHIEQNVATPLLEAVDAPSAYGEASGEESMDRMNEQRHFLKNGAEEEMNVLAFDEPRFIDIRAGQRQGTSQ